MFNFTPARGTTVRLSDYYGETVALRPTTLIPSMTFRFEDGVRTVKDVPRVDVILVAEDGTVSREGTSLVLPQALADRMREALEAHETPVGVLTHQPHPTNDEWSLVTLEDIADEDAPAVFAALEQWADATSGSTHETSGEPVSEEAPF